MILYDPVQESIVAFGLETVFSMTVCLMEYCLWPYWMRGQTPR